MGLPSSPPAPPPPIPLPTAMPPRFALLLSTLSLLCTSTQLGAQEANPLPPERPSLNFDFFAYKGSDDLFTPTLPSGSYRNPILAGFYADPSICRVGDDYYLVNSSFAYFPGIPVFKSKDLIHWKQLGHAIDRPGMLNYDGLGVSRGIFAPAIRYHDGLFYIITTHVDAGGNFYLTAKDPAGPWSDPIWLPEIDGIDPSFFFEEEGRAWIINNGPPPENKPLYDGHRAIWIQEFSVATGKPVGPRSIIVNGGVDLSTKPVWIEGPHLYKHQGWYFLTCAEGGTSINHSQVVLRSRSPQGPFEPWSDNPILTQRDLDPKRPDPITCTGHADLVQTQNGDWWSVFLGCRPYPEGNYNTGRETFLLPVSWADGWPRILEKGLPVPLIAQKPALPEAAEPLAPNTGNFLWRDEFNPGPLVLEWNLLRTPSSQWFQLDAKPGWLSLTALPEKLTGTHNSAFIARRQQHQHCQAETALELPSLEHCSGGLVAFQNETHHYYLGVRLVDSKPFVFLELANKSKTPRLLKQLPLLESNPGSLVLLRVKIEGALCHFYYSEDGDNWSALALAQDAKILSTDSAGGFVGTYLGVHARAE